MTILRLFYGVWRFSENNSMSMRNKAHTLDTSDHRVKPIPINKSSIQWRRKRCSNERFPLEQRTYPNYICRAEGMK